MNDKIRYTDPDNNYTLIFTKKNYGNSSNYIVLHIFNKINIKLKTYYILQQYFENNIVLGLLDFSFNNFGINKCNLDSMTIDSTLHSSVFELSLIQDNLKIENKDVALSIKDINAVIPINNIETLDNAPTVCKIYFTFDELSDFAMQLALLTNIDIDDAISNFI